MIDSYKYTFGLEGQQHFMRAAIDALEPLERALKEGDWEESPESFKSNPTLYTHQSPTAFSGVEIVGGLAVFTATCFGKKVFDEFFDRLWKRPVGKCIDTLLEKLNIQDHKLLEFRDVVYFEDLNVAIVVRNLTKTQGAEIIDAQLLEAHSLAHEYLSKNGKKAPIHCHRVVEGKVDPEPQFYISIESMRNEERSRIMALRRYGDRSI
ncbi:hypothetical protein [Alicycliphilus denitrificans]|uniref:hypothetical protein n=1 Tax=Alicycliphilus denitrificans TaxID=179636 RepID=UPI003850E1CB